MALTISKIDSRSVNIIFFDGVYEFISQIFFIDYFLNYKIFTFLKFPRLV